MSTTRSDSADDLPVYVISVAARLASMHPQTLRQYDRLGLVVPRRARGRGRRYSPRDVEALREIQRLSAEEGINLAGIQRILALEIENRALRRAIEELRVRAQAERRFFAVGPEGEATALARGRRPTRNRTGDPAAGTPGPSGGGAPAGMPRAGVPGTPMEPFARPDHAGRGEISRAVIVWRPG
jgi:MerR family transcriptional regulator/heat shock protein HspR